MTDKIYPGMPRPVRDYQAWLAQGKFMLQRSRETGRFIFHPRVAEPLTGCTDLEWVEASGQGTVYSTTVVRHRSASDDYNVALINLAEGPRMMSRVEGIPPGDVRIGMPVTAKIIDQGGTPLLVFTPA
mgnify:CR=1 FL=1